MKRRKMKSSKRGKNISKIEIQNISKVGIWLFIKGKEYFLSHERYPWFEEAKIVDITNVQLLHGGHLHWPDLDVDLELDSLEYPERYPLVDKKVKCHKH